MTFPQFWFAPDAYALDDVPRGPVRLTGFAMGAAYAEAMGAARATLCAEEVVIGAEEPPKMLNCWRPPGGAWMRVVERSVMTLPQFWFAPDA